MTKLVLPGSIEFALTLQHLPPPPDWRAAVDRSAGETVFIAPLGGGGLLEAVSLERALEYANDGELEARQDEIDALEAQTEGIILGI